MARHPARCFFVVEYNDVESQPFSLLSGMDHLTFSNDTRVQQVSLLHEFFRSSRGWNDSACAVGECLESMEWRCSCFTPLGAIILMTIHHLSIQFKCNHLVFAAVSTLFTFIL